MEEKEVNSAPATTMSQATETGATTMSASSGSETHQNDINNMAEDAEREHEPAVHESPVEHVIDPSTLNPLSPEVISRHTCPPFMLVYVVVLIVDKRRSTLGRSAMLPTASRPSSRPSPASTQSASKTKLSVTSQSNLATRTQRSQQPVSLSLRADAHILGRSTNATTPHVPVPAATNPSPPTKKSTRPASVPAVVGK
jgi:hypothetical protein